MAKAQITTAEGIKINIEGTPSEISSLVHNLKEKVDKRTVASRHKIGKAGRVLLGDLIASLADGGFFKKPKDLASIKAALAEMGHHYPVTTLSPVMLRLVRRRALRRIRQNKRWLYTR
jgi:hypothetical protein